MVDYLPREPRIARRIADPTPGPTLSAPIRALISRTQIGLVRVFRLAEPAVRASVRTCTLAAPPRGSGCGFRASSLDAADPRWDECSSAGSKANLGWHYFRDHDPCAAGTGYQDSRRPSHGCSGCVWASDSLSQERCATVRPGRSSLKSSSSQRRSASRCVSSWAAGRFPPPL